MRILLKKDVPGVGKAGEIKEVKDGYARNYLIPKGLAVEASEGLVKGLQKQRKLDEKRHELLRKKSEELLGKLQASPVVMRVKAGEKGKIYGSITTAMVAEAIKRKIDQEFDKHWVILESPIRSTGIHKVKVSLPGGVKGEIVVKVEAE
ncbi:MAG: 50S ribosomal protein L9 [Thermotogae bacterium]|nr:50S ribosomal protein L9 [Thermotogota bacterium]